MKETYLSPKLELLCLAPEEQLALLSHDFDGYLGGEGNSENVSGVIIDPEGDIDLILP